MPTIPFYKRQTTGPRQLGAAKQPAGLPQGAFGENNWRLLEKAGAGIQNLGAALERRQREDDRLNAEDAYLKFSDELRVLEHGVDGAGGFYSLKGSLARGNTKNLDSEVEKLRNKYSTGLENERQKTIFGSQTGRLRKTSLDAMAKQEERERNVWRQNILNARIKSDNQNTLNLYKDPKLFYNSLDQTDQAVRDSLEANGVPREAIAVEVHKNRSSLISTSIMKMAKDSPELATSWYQKAKKDEDMTFEDKAKVEAFLENQDFRAQSQAHADKIMLQHGDDETKALEQSRKLSDSKIRDSVTQRVKARFQQQKAIQNETDFKEADAQTMNISNAATYDKAMEHVGDTPTGRYKKANESYARWRFGVGKGGRRQPANPVKLQELKERIDKTTQGVAKPDEKIQSIEQIGREYGPYISSGELQQGINYFNNDGNIQYATRSKLKPLYEELTESKISDDKELYAAFVQDVTAQLEAVEKPTEDDFRKMASRFFIKGESGEKEFFSIGYGADIDYGEAVKKGAEKSWLPVINDENRVETNAMMEEYNQRRIALKKPPVPINERTMRRFYKRYFMRLPHDTQDEK